MLESKTLAAPALPALIFNLPGYRRPHHCGSLGSLCGVCRLLGSPSCGSSRKGQGPALPPPFANPDSPVALWSSGASGAGSATNGLQPQAVRSPEATDQVPLRGSFKGERLLGALVDARGGTGQCIRLRRPPRTGRGGSPSQLWHGRGDAA